MTITHFKIHSVLHFFWLFKIYIFLNCIKITNYNIILVHYVSVIIILGTHWEIMLSFPIKHFIKQLDLQFNSYMQNVTCCYQHVLVLKLKAQLSLTTTNKQLNVTNSS